LAFSFVDLSVVNWLESSFGRCLVGLAACLLRLILQVVEQQESLRIKLGSGFDERVRYSQFAQLLGPEDQSRFGAAVARIVSKRYEGDYQPYWYAFHPNWDRFLSEGKDAYFILSCMDRAEAYAVPFSVLDKNKKSLNMTDRGDRSYWHVALTTMEDGCLAINLSRIGKKLALKPFAFGLSAAAKAS